MEQYLDAKIKRFTQKQLFKKITKVKTMLGLHPEKYLEVVPEHKNCVLVDFNPADALVRRNSLIRDLLILQRREVRLTSLIVISVSPL